MAILEKKTLVAKIISTLKYRKNRFGSFTQTNSHWCGTHCEREITPNNEMLELCARLFQDMEDTRPENELEWLLAHTNGEFGQVITLLYDKYKTQNKFRSPVRRWFYKKLSEYLRRIRQYLP